MVLYDLDNKTEKSVDLKGCAKHENNSYFTSQQLQAAYQAACLKKMFFHDVMISGHDKTASINFQVQGQNISILSL